MERPPIELTSTVLGAPDARALAGFYQRLLGWERVADAEDWVQLLAPNGRDRLSFQPEPHHVPPVWPGEPGDQQMQLHLDFAVADLDEGVAWATTCGARLSEHQPQEQVRVLLDPVGHVFCLFPDPELGRHP